MFDKKWIISLLAPVVVSLLGWLGSTCYEEFRNAIYIQGYNECEKENLKEYEDIITELVVLRVTCAGAE